MQNPTRRTKPVDAIMLAILIFIFFTLGGTIRLWNLDPNTAFQVIMSTVALIFILIMAFGSRVISSRSIFWAFRELIDFSKCGDNQREKWLSAIGWPLFLLFMCSPSEVNDREISSFLIFTMNLAVILGFSLVSTYLKIF